MLDRIRLSNKKEAKPYYTIEDRHILFELNIESGISTVYTEDGNVRQRWNKS